MIDKRASIRRYLKPREFLLKMKSSSIFTEEDGKTIRKLRKVLRQIEHLGLVTRPLNDEEKAKLARRAEYRKELLLLNEKCAQHSRESQVEQEQNDSKSDIDDSHLILTNTSLELIQQDNESASYENHSESFSATLDQLSSQLEQYKIEENQTKHDDPVAAAGESVKADRSVSKQEEQTKQTKDESNSNMIKTKQQGYQQPKAMQVETVAKKVEPIAKRVIQFECPVNDPNAHEDLIVSVDVCMDSKLIVTGRYLLKSFFIYLKSCILI